jgi:hypothetical protein
MKCFLWVIAIVGLVIGQSAYNTKIYQFSIATFKTDSSKVTGWFPAGDGEGIDVIIKSAAKDSSVFQVGYQRGYWDGGAIIPKRPFMVIDTFNTLTGANFQAIGTSIAAINDTDLVQAIDTNSQAGTTGFVYMVRHVFPYRSPHARITLKGLTGNKNTFFNVFVTVSQPKYFNVDVGTGKGQ